MTGLTEREAARRRAAGQGNAPARGAGRTYAGILRECRDAYGYAYGAHWGPHDIEVKELGTGQSRIEIAGQMGIHFQVAKRMSLEDGINAARMLLPRC